MQHCNSNVRLTDALVSRVLPLKIAEKQSTRAVSAGLPNQISVTYPLGSRESSTGQAAVLAGDAASFSAAWSSS
jgi:hypothetical protein